MMNDVVYSVIIPDLHSSRIGEVLDALRRQEGVDRGYEILVVGRDKYGLVRQHEAEDKRVRFLESERDLNPAEARNRGIKAARGRVVFFIDADCVPVERWMKTLLKTYYEGNPVVGGAVWYVNDDYWTLCDNVAHLHDLLPDKGRGRNRHFMAGTGNMLAEKDILEKVGMFDESFPVAEDFGLSRRIRNAGYDLYFEPDALVIHKPDRDNLRAVLDHSASWARHSIRIRTIFKDELATPWFMFQPMMLRVLSPAIAAAVTAKVFAKHPCVRRYWYTAPVVFLTKLVWCWAAAAEVAAGRHHAVENQGGE